MELDKTPDSIVIPSISDDDVYRCYKLQPPVNITEGGALIRTGEEFENDDNTFYRLDFLDFLDFFFLLVRRLDLLIF